MPAMIPVVIEDRAATPLAHTFAPRSIKNDVAEFVNTTGVPLGNERLTLSIKKAGSYYKGEARLLLPVLATETINGVARPSVLRTAVCTFSCSFHETSSRQERDDAIGMMYKLLVDGGEMTDGMFVDLTDPY